MISTEKQAELLQRFKADTYRAIEEGISLNPVLHSFQLVVNQYMIERELIDAFLFSMEMDLHHHQYEDPQGDSARILNDEYDKAPAPRRLDQD